MPQQQKCRTPSTRGCVQPPAPEVARRLCDMLLSFPSAAIGGVQWQVLARRYEERYSTRLDLAALGHSSPLAAATALLWEVLRMVDKDDTDNPIVGIEDEIALTPEPGSMGCWPSLYGALCTLVQEHGIREAGTATHSLLLSQLRPLLERHWNPSFDESSLGFRSEDGAFFRFKKMKHLLHAVLRWREQRQAWQRAHNLKPTAVDEVLMPTLDLVPSKRHNDLLLRCVHEPTLPSLTSQLLVSGSDTSSSAGDEDLQFEVERLRTENNKLRAANLQLQASSQMLDSASTLEENGKIAAATPYIPEVFDDPFEPPPELNSWMLQHGSSPALSCRFLSSGETDTDVDSVMWGVASSCSGWSGLTSTCASGGVTPVHLPQASCTMPAWFPASNGVVGVSVIPRGIVQSAREHFERWGAAKH